jgi:hypothetical protein
LPSLRLFYESDVRRSEQARIVAAFGAHYLRAARRDGESPVRDVLADVLNK